MRLIAAIFLLGLTSACVAYGTGDETGLITPIGTFSDAEEDAET